MEDIDISKSTLHFLAYQAIKTWSADKLLPLLADADSVVRTLAAQQLQLNSSDLIFNEVIKLLGHTTDYVRESAAFVLGQLGTPERPYRDKALPYLLDMINDKSEDVRGAAIAALGHLYVEDEKMPNAVTQLIIKLASDSSSEVRSCVAFALGHSVSSDIVISTLEQLKHDSIEEVCSFAELGLDLLAE